MMCMPILDDIKRALMHPETIRLMGLKMSDPCDDWSARDLSKLNKE